MKKNLTRVLALAMALLMCLSLLPVSALAMTDPAAILASAQAAQAAAMGGAAPDMTFVMPEQALDYTDPNACLASDDGQHLWIEVHDPAYICAWGDCTEENPHILYKSCAYCKQSAEPLYANELEAIQNEAQVFAETQEEIPPEQYDDWDYRAYHKYIFELPDHFYEKQDGQAPTCTAGGHTAYEQCSVCEEIRGYEELDPLGHNWGDYTVTVEPTCTAAGTKMRECLRCGEKEYADIPALGHDWGEFVTVKEPTCTETGTTKRVCERCGAEDFGEIPANGHSYGDFTILKEATCTEDGSKEHTCTVCEYKETVVIPAAHTWGDFTVTKEPTCAEAGEKEHTCLVCEFVETETIPATGVHTWDNGVCTVCGAEKPAEPAVVEPAVEEPKDEEPKDEEPKEELKEEPAGAQPVGAIVEDCRDMYSSFGAFLAEKNAADAKYVVASYTPVDANGYALGEVPAGGVRFELPLPEGVNAETDTLHIYTYSYETGIWSPANFFLSDGQATVSSGAYPYPPFAVVSAPAAAGNSGETTPTKQEASSEETVNEFKDLMDEKGISADDPAGIVAKKVTPLREDGTEMSNEEVAAQGGVTFEMDLPENYEEGDELEFYHKNSETGEWERVTDFEIKGNKVIIHADHFSDFLGYNTTKGGNTALRAGGEDKVTLTGGDSITQSALVYDTLTAVPDTSLGTPDECSYQWYSATSKNSGESPINNTNAKSQSYQLTTNEIGKYVFCIVTPPGQTGKRSPAYKVRMEISFTLEVTGKGKVAVEITDGITNNTTNPFAPESTFDHTGADTVEAKVISCYTGDTVKLIMTPLVFNSDELNDYVVRKINDIDVVSPSPETRSFTATLDGTDGKKYSVLFDVLRNYGEDDPTEDKDIAYKSGTKAAELYAKLKTDEAARLHVSPDDFVGYASPYLRYVTPVWNSNPTAPTDAQVAGINGYKFILDYPAGTNKDDYLIFVYHYNGISWDGPLADGVTLKDDKIVVKYNDFSPFTVLALPKIEVKEKVSAGGTVLRNNTAIPSDGAVHSTLFVAGTVLTYTVTPDANYGAKAVTINGTPVELNSSGTYQLTVSTTNPNTFEVTFVQLEVVEEEASSEVKSSFDTFAAANDLTSAAKKVVKEIPKWVGGAPLTQDEIEKTGGISIELPYPTDQVKAERANYVIQVFQQNGSTWTEITDSISQTDTGLMLTTTNFAPFAVTAVRKDVTLKFQVGDTTISALDMPARNGKAVKLPDGSAYSGDKAFKGWNTEPDFTGDSYKAGDSYTPNSGTEPEIKFYAELMTAVTITFEPGEGVGSVYTQPVPQGVATDLIKNEFTRPEYVFKEWKVKDGTATYKDRGQITTTAPVTLVAQWDPGTAPSAPADLKAGRSLLNYGYSDLENQSGLISGVNNSMQIYSGHGNWDKINETTYTVTEPGKYEIRFAPNTTLKTPASESAFVEVSSYYTEASDPIKLDDTHYLYTVKLYEEYENGSIEERHETALKEDVMFLLDYPAGVNNTKNAFTLYHVVSGTYQEVECEALNSGIRASSDSFSDYILEVQDKIKGTVILDNYSPMVGEPVTANAALSPEAGTPSYQWYRVNNDGTEDLIPGATSPKYTVTSDDLMHKLNCRVTGSDPKKGYVKSDNTNPIDVKYYPVPQGTGDIGVVQGVTADMEYSTDGGKTFQKVPAGRILNGNFFLVYDEGKYYFRDKGNTDPEYYADEDVEMFYVVAVFSEYSTAYYTATITPAAGTAATSPVKTYDVPGADYAWRVKPGTPVSVTLRTTSSGSTTGGTTSTYYIHYAVDDPNRWTNGRNSAIVNLGQVRADHSIYVSVNNSSTSPRTADDSHLGLWSALCFMSLAGATVLLNGQRKRRKARR